LQLQRSQASLANLEVADLIMLLDFGYYHKRRNGYDQRKYCAAASATAGR
jgi:hypothetical protein